MWMCAYVCMYREGKGESKLYVLCSCLSTGLIMIEDQSILTACIFPCLTLSRMNDVDVTRISSHCDA